MVSQKQNAVCESLPSALVIADDRGVSEIVSLERYRFLMKYPVWNVWTSFLRSTRSYGESIDFGFTLLRGTLVHAQYLSAKETRRNLQLIFHLILSSLDRLDRWDEFLALRDLLMRVDSLYSTYALDSRHAHGEALSPFILGIERGMLKVHFLWGIEHRTRIIQKKIRKREADCLNRSLFHRQKCELTKEEIQRRIEWLIDWYRSRNKAS